MPELEQFEPLYTADEMRAAEARHPDLSELMERAGARAAEAGLRAFPDAASWTVVCGGGSNGGDGRIMARHLENAGKRVRVVDAKAEEAELGDPEVIVDALFGTGFSGEPRAAAAALIDSINASPARVFAIDLPSGVDASTGEVAGVAVRADATVTLHARKVGLVVAPGRLLGSTAPRAGQQVHRRTRARRRWVTRAHRRSVALGARRDAGRRRLCHGRRARVGAARARAAPARGGEATAA